MTTTAHNHPPRCCCIWRSEPDGKGDLTQVRTDCPLCITHGELAQLAENREYPGQPGEKVMPCCHQLKGRPHTDYCPTLGQHPASTADAYARVIDAPPAPTRGAQPPIESWPIDVRQPDGTTRPATRDDHLDLIGVPACTCPPAQIVGSGGDTIDQAEDPSCPRHGEPLCGLGHGCTLPDQHPGPHQIPPQ